MNAANDNKNQTDDEIYFGACPHCHEVSEHFNVGRNHWGACHHHRVRWHIGENLFSSWQDETKDDWSANEVRFRSYSAVEPHYLHSTPLEPAPGGHAA